jgi:hypothetical protein
MVLTIVTRRPQEVAHQAMMYGVDFEIIEREETRVFAELSGTAEKTIYSILGTGTEIVDRSRRVIRADAPQGNYVRYEFR